MLDGPTWIVGASEGLGRALALALGRQGVPLILSARNADRLDDLAASLADARALPMDVRHPGSVARAVASAGPVGCIVYCAGAYEPMTARNWDAEASVAMTEVNFTGALRVLGRVVPQMAERGRGHVVLIGSLGGFRGLPGAIGYGASKAGLMHLAENLHADLRGSGVRVQVVNPGFIDTRLTRKNSFAMPFLMTPEAAAERVAKAMRGRRFSVSFPAPFAWLFTLGRHLPLRLFQALF